MNRFPIMKGLSGDQKVAKLLGVGLDKRQIVILVCTVFGYWLLYKQIAKLISLTTPQALVLFSPLVVMALAVAFIRYDGRHLDWWAQKKVSNAMKPKVLKWVGSRGGARDPKALRNSIQAILPAEKILWEMVRVTDGTYVIIFEVRPVNLSLSSDAERERVWATAAQMYDRLNFPIVEITRSREGNVKTYSESLRTHVIREVQDDQIKLAQFAREHLDFLEDLVPLYNVFERTGYVLLPYKPEKPLKRKSGKGAKTKRGLRDDQREAEDSYKVLAARAEIVMDAFSRMGVRLRLLTDSEIIEVLRDQINGEKPGPPANVWTPITHEVNPYRTQKKIQNAVAVQQKERAKTKKKGRRPAPPAVGVGQLSLADKIAPGTVRIHADYLRVEARYMATLFIYDYPKDIAFGDLQSLLNIDGRMNLVKYVNPMPQAKAIQAMGSMVAELEAAEYTASDGNVMARRQRHIAQHSASQAMTELQTGSQGLFDVSFLIHCEAADKDALNSLVEEVRTKLAGIRAEAKLAREETLEGWFSSLGLGNQLSKRYANRGILTHPLACLFIHGSYKLDHEDGVLHGIDPYTGGLVVLDNRDLTNPHMIVLATSGGGKTVTIKALSTRQRMRGHRVVIIDPVGDSKYGAVAREVGGEYVVFGLGSPSKFNPCALGANYMNINLLAGANDDEDPEEARRKARAAGRKGKILMLTRMIDLMISADDGTSGLSSMEYGLVDRAWSEVYTEKGIADDPDTHDRTPPIMPDFFRKCGEIPGLAEVRARLYPWEYGALSDIYDSQTNVDLSNKFLVLQVANVKGREKAAIMYGLLEFLNSQLSDASEPSECYIDEFWSLLKYKMSAEFAEEMFRSGRARNNAMTAISQDIKEFLDSGTGQVIMRLAATQLLLKQSRKTVEIIGEFVNLSDSQKYSLTVASEGEGFIICDDVQIPIYIICSDKEHELYNTDPRREAQYERQRQLTEQAAAQHKPTPHPSPTDRARGLLAANHLDATTGRPAARKEPETIQAAVEQAIDEQVVEAVQVAVEEAVEDVIEEVVENAVERRLDGSPTAYPQPVSPLDIPQAFSGEVPIHAVVGDGAATVAYDLARVLAAATRHADRTILFVDTMGDISGTLKSRGLSAPDDLVMGDGEVNLSEHLPLDEASGLSILPAPEDPRIPAARLIEAANDWFDVVIVACDASLYARDWLTAAHTVVATGDAERPERILDAAAASESHRGHNGTILAPVGDHDPEGAGSALTVDGHRVLAVRSTRLLASHETESSVALLDLPASGAYRPLLQTLLADTTTDKDPTKETGSDQITKSRDATDAHEPKE